MMAANSLPISVHLIVPSGVSSCWPSPCRRACRACAFAPHPTPSFNVQVSCLEHARPMAVAAFFGGLAAGSTALPGRRRPERKRGAKAEGKIKGRGTLPLENPVCTWEWRGTRQEAATCRESAQCHIGIGESACFARWTALLLDGVAR